MSDVYENCPAFENDKFLLRFSQLDDAGDLVSVYSDKNALPFFNSDNCHGDNFYYPNEDRMRQAIKFWLSSYSSKWFVRWTIIDKEKHEAIGTIEVFHRSANDDFNHVGVLRLDLKSEYETSEEIFTIMNLIVPPTFDLFECEEIITKVPVYAVERIEAMKRVGFKKSTKLLVGTMDGYAYKDYWTINRGVSISSSISDTASSISPSRYLLFICRLLISAPDNKTHCSLSRHSAFHFRFLPLPGI